jgi:peptide/nickel transport system permease protein
VVGREINLIMAITLFTGLALIIANLLADIAYAVLDPRIRY